MKRKKKSLLNLLSFFGIIVAICITTIGYSAFNSNLTISGDAVVKVENNISIVDLNVSSLESEAYEQYNSSHYIKTIDYNIMLPNPDSTITYKIDIKNKGSKDYGIALINGLSDNLTYELIGYNLGDKLCTGNTCNNNAIDEIYLKIKYKPDQYDSENINFSGRIKFEFEYFYNVVYKNIPNSSSLKNSVLKNTTYEENISVPENHKLVIRMNGVLLVKDINYTYDTNTNLLTIPNVISNIVISIEEIGTEFDLSITGDKKAFKYQNVEYDINNNTFYLEADLSQIDLANEFENIISIGNDVDQWFVTYPRLKGVNLHIYYPASPNTTSFEVDLTYLTESRSQQKARFQKSIELDNFSLIRIAFNSNGLYINGEKILDKTGKETNVVSTDNNLSAFLETYFDYWETNGLSVDIGSLEGNNRSNAIYNEIKIYDQLLSSSEMIEKTKIQLEEKPIKEEVTYDIVSTALINNSERISINYPFQPNNNKFIFTNPDFVDLNSNSLYFEIDVSNLKEGAELENLISIGNDFSNWIGDNVYDFHVFYPNEVNTNDIVISLLNGRTYYSQFKGTVPLIDDKLIKIMICSKGIYINGEKWLGVSGQIKSGVTAFGNNSSPTLVVSEFFKKFTFPNDNNIRFRYGSEQGTSRSSATYNDMRIYAGVLKESEIIDLTS